MSLAVGICNLRVPGLVGGRGVHQRKLKGRGVDIFGLGIFNGLRCRRAWLWFRPRSTKRTNLACEL